jgi:hypothetical protein
MTTNGSLGPTDKNFHLKKIEVCVAHLKVGLQQPTCLKAKKSKFLISDYNMAKKNRVGRWE